jgi:cyclase
MRRILFATPAAVTLAAASFTAAQQPPAAPLQVHQLTPTIYWVAGAGGNSGVIIGEHGVIVIDTKVRPDSGKQLLDDITQITPKPVTAVIETHSDIDHIGGLPSFPKGITIIAHANNVKEQQEALAKGGPEAPAADRLPTKIVSKDKEDLTIDGIKFELLHWGPAHTNGDLTVFLPGEKLVFTGDIIEGNRFRPEIHIEKNGTSAGWIANVKGMLALNATQYVSGHAGVLDKPAIEKYLNDVETERAKVKELVAQGQTLDRIKAAVGDPPPGAARGYGVSFPAFSEVVYRELTPKAP